MVWNQELLFPPHEYGSPIRVFHSQMRLLEVAHITEGGEAAPVDHVFLFCSAPIPCQEAVPAADDLCIKVGGKFWPIIGQPANTEVPAQVGRREIHILRERSIFRNATGPDSFLKITNHNGYADIVAVPAALLCALEGSAGV